MLFFFKKNDFLVFCDNYKNKTIINIYLKIINQLHDKIFSFIDEFEDEKFYFDGDSTKFRFKTDDNLVYDEKINIPVCIISVSSVIKKIGFTGQSLNYKNVCMKIFLKNIKTFFVNKYKRWITILIIKK